MMVISVWLFKQEILGVQNVELYLKEKAACLFCQSGKKNELVLVAVLDYFATCFDFELSFVIFFTNCLKTFLPSFSFQLDLI